MVILSYLFCWIMKLAPYSLSMSHIISASHCSCWSPLPISSVKFRTCRALHRTQHHNRGVQHRACSIHFSKVLVYASVHENSLLASTHGQYLLCVQIAAHNPEGPFSSLASHSQSTNCMGDCCCCETGFFSPKEHSGSRGVCSALAVQGALNAKEQFIPSIFGEQELYFGGACISSRHMNSDCLPDFRMVEVSRDEFKPTCTTLHLNIVTKGRVSRWG